MDRPKIEDYKQISCGCCTGRTVESHPGDHGYGGYRIAKDQCVCFIHRNPSAGMPQRTCTVHLKEKANV